MVSCSLGYLDDLYKVVLERIESKPACSYTARLAEKGVDYVARKIGEEAVEVVVEAVRRSREGVVREVADLLYHVTVLLALLGVPPSEVACELASRRGGGGCDG